MKLILLACLVALSAAAPQFGVPSSRGRFVQPSTRFVQPTTRFVQPSTRFVQPSTRFVQPETQFVQPQYRIIQVLRDSRTEDRGDGNYNYEFETENGIYTNIVGRTGSAGQTNQSGSFRFTLPDGTLAEVSFVADENGYRAESPLLPQAPPMPAHALEQIKKAEEERARGIQYDGHGFRIGGF